MKRLIKAHIVEVTGQGQGLGIGLVRLWNSSAMLKHIGEVIEQGRR